MVNKFIYLFAGTEAESEQISVESTSVISGAEPSNNSDFSSPLDSQIRRAFRNGKLSKSTSIFLETCKRYTSIYLHTLGT